MEHIFRSSANLSAEHRELPPPASPSDAAMLEDLCHWFVQRGVAWTGTPGELAGVLGCSSEQLMHAMEVASLTLLVFGVSGSVCKRRGLPTVICLRRLEEICNQCENSTAACDTPLSLSSTADNLMQEQSSEGESGHDAATEMQSSDSAAPSEPLDDEWHRKLVLAALNPADDPADRPRANLAWKALAVLGLILAIAITNRSVISFTGRIGSRLKSLLSKSVTQIPDNDRLIGGSDKTSEATPASNTGELPSVYQEATADNREAHHRLGMNPVAGDGVARNEADAVAWFRQAAQKGNPNAQFELGMAYLLGRGVGQDNVESFTWLTLASLNGNTQAEQPLRELTPRLSHSEMANVRWNLAEMYRQGVGAKSDKTTAYVWYILAEASGEKRSTKAKLNLAKSMSDEQVTDATTKALMWLKRHHM
jgi:TPR repeat protein